MQLDLTKKEYRALVDMVSIADWIMNAHEESATKPFVEHEAIKRKLLSLYKDMESDDIVKFEKKSNDYLVTKDYEEQIIDTYIAPYEDIFFWDELANRLAERDVINNLGMKKYSQMDGIERICAVSKIEENYTAEFVERGIEHLELNREHIVKKKK